MVVQITFDDSKKIEVALSVNKFSLLNRIRRSLKIFGILLLAAIVSVFIPVIHFLLVPAFVISAFVVAVIRFNQVSYVDLTGFNCPKCSQPLNETEIYQNKKANFLKVYCYHCRSNMNLEIH